MYLVLTLEGIFKQKSIGKIKGGQLHLYIGTQSGKQQLYPEIDGGKTTLLVQDSPHDAEIEEMITCLDLGELTHYPEFHIDPDHDYGEDCYEKPLPNLSDAVRDELCRLRFKTLFNNTEYEKKKDTHQYLGNSN